MSFKSQGSSRRAPVRTPHTPAAARPGGSREPGTQPGLFPWAAGPANAAVTCCLQEARRVTEQLAFPCRDWTAGPRCRPQITFYYLLHLTRLRKTGILSCFKCLHFVRRRSSCLLCGDVQRSLVSPTEAGVWTLSHLCTRDTAVHDGSQVHNEVHRKVSQFLRMDQIA